MYTVDTNVIIYYLQNDGVAVSFFERAAEQRVPLYVAGISETELLGYPPLTESDIRAIENTLALCFIVHTNARITRLAATLRRMYRLKTVDALIAATALFTSSVLITRNVKDFSRIKELTLEKV